MARMTMWAYDPDICDGDFCPMNCDYCSKAYDREEGSDIYADEYANIDRD